METKYTRKNRSNTEIELEITIPKEVFSKAYKDQLTKQVKDSQIKGFRKGNAPTELVEKNAGSEALEKAVVELMPKYTVDVIEKEKIMPAGLPLYQIKQVAKDNDAIFVALIPVIPEFKVADVTKLGVKEESTSVEDKEVEDVLKRLWQEHKGKSKNMDDEWAKTVATSHGFQGKTLKEFREEIRNAIVMQKANVVKQKYATDLLNAAIEKSGLEVPEILVQREAYERETAFREDLNRLGVTEQQFTTLRNVTMEQLRAQWLKDSMDALRADIFLNKYAEVKGIKVEKSELDKEIDAIKKSNPKAKPELFDSEQWQRYIERVVLKRKAYAEFLKEAGFEPEQAKDSKKSNNEKKPADKAKKSSKK